MRKPRTNILLLMTIFVIVGLVGQAWLAGKSAFATLAVPNRTVVLSPVVPAKDTGLAQPKTSDLPTGMQESGVHDQAMLPQEISADASVLVTEMCDLHLLAQGTELSLNSRQWPAFAAVVLRCQAIRHAYEAQIAQVRMIAPGQGRVEIPTYAAWGGELRQQFSHELCADLGEAPALEVMAKLGDRLEKRFAGFGGCVQTLDIVADSEAEPNDMQITRTVEDRIGAKGGERLTPRCEMHFPVLEDPTGDTWSAMLAKMVTVSQADGPG